MKPTPSRFITAQSKNPLHPQSTGTRLLTGDQPRSPKPNSQGQMGPLEDCARSHCGLTPTILAGPAMTPIQPTRLSLTGRTDKAVGPAQLNQILAASVFSSKPLFHFQQPEIRRRRAARQMPGQTQSAAQNQFSPAGDALKGKFRAVQQECYKTVKIWALFNPFRRQGMERSVLRFKKDTIKPMVLCIFLLNRLWRDFSISQHRKTIN